MNVNSPLLPPSSPKRILDRDSEAIIYNPPFPPPPTFNAIRITYTAAIIANGISTILTIASLYYPNWFRGREQIQPLSLSFVYSHLGLGEQCLYNQPCTPFPTTSDCRNYGQGFCAAWQSSAFSMWVALVFQTTSQFALFFTLLINTKPILQTAWKLIITLIATSALFEILSTITMAVLLETNSKFHGHDKRFWSVGSSWAYALTSWILSLFIILSLTIVGLLSDDGDPTPPFDNDTDCESLSTEGDNQPHDDFYYFNRQSRRNYLACNT